MNDEKFAYYMRKLRDDLTLDYWAEQLTARDTAQREALAQVEAGLEQAIKLLGWSNYQLMLWEDYQVENGFEVEDHYVTGKVREEVDAFLARHAQAEQKEAQGYNAYAEPPYGRTGKYAELPVRLEQQEAQGAQAGEGGEV